MNEEEEGNKSLISMYGNEYKKQMKKHSQEGTRKIISQEIRYRILVEQKWKCNVCCTKLKFSITSSWEGEIAHIDHIHPFSKRETYVNGVTNINEIENLQGLCPLCNLKKGVIEK